MAMSTDHKPVTSFDQWYVDRAENDRTGCLEYRGLSERATGIIRKYEDYKREMDARVANYYKLEMIADNEVVGKKHDLPNISSGETSGLVRRIARNLVQNTPNLEVVSKFDDDSMEGIFARHILLTRVVGSDTYSNDMQQNLFASTKTSLTLGFACVIPALLQDAGGSWYIEYDSIHYRDVFPEPGAKDIRKAQSVFIRRYLTKGEVKALIRDQVPGWDIAALKLMLQSNPPAREQQSAAHADKKHHVIPDGYEIITWYNSAGEPFLTFAGRERVLLRIEVNKHPLKQHPVHFLVLEKDEQQPLGKSQVELLYGRQEFQDLMFNGAMKLWYRNINPAIIGYGSVNAAPNLGPGKYTEISNPNARLEPFEVNTQTLLQYGAISQNNLGSMVQMVGAADQQMATQSGNNGMSATPQGVEAQQAMVDITTNNYQKAIESFFSHYCSYALTIYFQELKGVKKITPTAETRRRLVAAGIDPGHYDENGKWVQGAFNEDGELEIDFSDLAVEYFVRCVPGSLVELEDEKQLRVLNELFVPLSQAMPALAASQDPTVLSNAAAAMQFIIEKTLELSGSTHSLELKSIFQNGRTDEIKLIGQRLDQSEQMVSVMNDGIMGGVETLAGTISDLQEKVSLITQSQQVLLEKLGVMNPESPDSGDTSGGQIPPAAAAPGNV